jgi:hypothetical protein
LVDVRSHVNPSGQPTWIDSHDVVQMPSMHVKPASPSQSPVTVQSSPRLPGRSSVTGLHAVPSHTASTMAPDASTSFGGHFELEHGTWQDPAVQVSPCPLSHSSTTVHGVLRVPPFGRSTRTHTVASPPAVIAVADAHANPSGQAATSAHPIEQNPSGWAPVA